VLAAAENDDTGGFAVRGDGVALSVMSCPSPSPLATLKQHLVVDRSTLDKMAQHFELLHAKLTDGGV
jgi:hypothetical protein